jgi:cellulose biosynthesis protein BcsQ
VQGLAAATHLLIPTKLDNPSTDAVVTFARQVETLRSAEICPDIKYVGVVATMVRGGHALAPYRKRLNDRLRQSWTDGGVDGRTVCLDMSRDILESVEFRDAGGEGIAYDVMGTGQNVLKVRNAIINLSQHVATEMLLPNGFRGEDSHEVKATACVA